MSSLSTRAVDYDLEAAHGRARRRHNLRVLLLEAGLLVAVPVAALLVMIADGGGGSGGNPATAGFITAPIIRGDLTIMVHATGTVEPTRLIEVSTELSGTLRQVLVKPNDPVKAGQVLAELDSSAAELQVTRARSVLAAARARLKEAQAAIRQAKADLERKRSLAANRLVAQREIDVAEFNTSRAQSSLDTLTAEIDTAQSDLKLAETNLAKTRIVSPVDGIVLRRNAEPGQAIAGSLQPPVLFRLAEALDQMQIRVDVDEADAMKVASGDHAWFSVQALRNRRFVAEVERIHIGPEIVQGVVTYKAILTFDNRELGLKPGMTASADIVVEQLRDVLMVPNAALRFEPGRPASGQPPAPGPMDRLLGIRTAISSTERPQLPAEPTATGDQPAPTIRRLFVVDRGAVRMAEVEVGASDGTMTVVSGADLVEGQHVITDEADPKQ